MSSISSADPKPFRMSEAAKYLFKPQTLIQSAAFLGSIAIPPAYNGLKIASYVFTAFKAGSFAWTQAEKVYNAYSAHVFKETEFGTAEQHYLNLHHNDIIANNHPIHEIHARLAKARQSAKMQGEVDRIQLEFHTAFKKINADLLDSVPQLRRAAIQKVEELIDDEQTRSTVIQYIQEATYAKLIELKQLNANLERENKQLKGRITKLEATIERQDQEIASLKEKNTQLQLQSAQHQTQLSLLQTQFSSEAHKSSEQAHKISTLEKNQITDEERSLLRNLQSRMAPHLDGLIAAQAALTTSQASVPQPPVDSQPSIFALPATSEPASGSLPIPTRPADARITIHHPVSEIDPPKSVTQRLYSYWFPVSKS